MVGEKKMGKIDVRDIIEVELIGFINKCGSMEVNEFFKDIFIS